MLYHLPLVSNWKATGTRNPQTVAALRVEPKSNWEQPKNALFYKDVTPILHYIFSEKTA
jgi:hypothetical protein